MKNRTKAYLLLLIATGISAVAGPVVKNTEHYLSPLIFLVYRFAISAGIGIVALSLTHHHNWPKNPQQKIVILFYSFLTTTVSLGLLFIGYEKTSALTASVLNALSPIMVGVAGVIFLREHITHREAIGMGIALLGTLFITVEPLLHANPMSTELVGNIIVIVALSLGVLLSVMTKKILRHALNPLSLTHVMFIVGFFTLLPVVLYLYPLSTILRQIIQAPWQAHAGVLYMALLSGTLAYTLGNIGQKSIEIGETSLFAYTYPIFVFPLSIFWLHETITPITIIALLIIATGVIISETKKRQKVNRRSPG